MWHRLSRTATETIKGLLMRSSSLFCTPLSRQQTRQLPFLLPVARFDRFGLDSLRVNEAPAQLGAALIYPDTCLFKAVCEDGLDLRILPSGGVCSADQLLESGFRQDYNVFGYLESKFVGEETLGGIVIATWPHRFLTYGDFLLQLLPEICLVKSIVPPDEWRERRIVVPRPPTFLLEYMAILGVAPSQVVDSRRKSLRPLPGSQVFFREKDPIWYLCAPPEMIHLTRHSLLSASPASARSLLFVERRGGYRNAVGLTEQVRRSLEALGVVFFDPASVSVREQIEAFSQARLVIGVHGGGLANILWCPSGTALIELFHPRYTPPCYAILAHHLELRYYCLGGDLGHLDIRFREADVLVDWPRLISLVTALLDGDGGGQEGAGA